MNFPRKNQKPEIPAQRADGLGGPRKVFQRDRDQPVRRWDNRNPLLDAVLMIFLVSETSGGSGRYPDGKSRAVAKRRYDEVPMGTNNLSPLWSISINSFFWAERAANPWWKIIAFIKANVIASASVRKG